MGRPELPHGPPVRPAASHAASASASDGPGGNSASRVRNFSHQTRSSGTSAFTAGTPAGTASPSTGVKRNLSCRAWTVGTSASPSTWTRPMMLNTPVGATIVVRPSARGFGSAVSR